MPLILHVPLLAWTPSLAPGMSMLFKPSYSEHLILLGQSDYFKNGMWPNQSGMAFNEDFAGTSGRERHSFPVGFQKCRPWTVHSHVCQQEQSEWHQHAREQSWGLESSWVLVTSFAALDQAGTQTSPTPRHKPFDLIAKHLLIKSYFKDLTV